MRTIFWIAGEKSGDLHASLVMQAFNVVAPHIQHVGIGGPLMQAQGLKALFPFEKFCVMGFAEVVKHLWFFYKVENAIKKYLLEYQPDLVVLVDYPGLNLRVAKIAYTFDLKVLYYICPQFWAWKHHRVNQLKSYCDYVATILPFEKDLLDIHNIPCAYVGHPVTEEISIELSKAQFASFYNLNPEKKWIAFFPGSRKDEVVKLLPIYQETIRRLREIKPDYEFLVSKANTISQKLFLQYMKDDAVHLIDGYTYEMMKYADFMIVKSGTSTIEATCIGTPFAIVYIANSISYYIAKNIIKVKYIGLPNIIFDNHIISELIQYDVNPQKIIQVILSYMDDPQRYNELKTSLNNIHSILGKKSASNTVSEIILKLIS